MRWAEPFSQAWDLVFPVRCGGCGGPGGHWTPNSSATQIIAAHSYPPAVPVPATIRTAQLKSWSLFEVASNIAAGRGVRLRNEAGQGAVATSSTSWHRCSSGTT
ncbi:hypothetical protein [Austwickia sp. TVS 96-490-7B]|uniref:hypothetical protein n=1 Tax=Austwickia sp. TVS 96-490-7B TaxID=2830843 RepID=UPI001C593FF0|nr:hypothetical protein [Austwickia sp. TVS 96-490-7B]